MSITVHVRMKKQVAFIENDYPPFLADRINEFINDVAARGCDVHDIKLVDGGAWIIYSEPML